MQSKGDIRVYEVNRDYGYILKIVNGVPISFVRFDPDLRTDLDKKLGII